MSVTSVCGIILASPDPKALAEFYSDALGISFEREEHGGLLEHFGVDIGEVHFGIHPLHALPPTTTSLPQQPRSRHDPDQANHGAGQGAHDQADDQGSH